MTTRERAPELHPAEKIAPTSTLYFAMVETWPWAEEHDEAPYCGSAVNVTAEDDTKRDVSLHLSTKDALRIAYAACRKGVDDFWQEPEKYRAPREKVEVEMKDNGRIRKYMFNDPIGGTCGDGRVLLELHSGRRVIDIWIPRAKVIEMAVHALELMCHNYSFDKTSGEGRL